MGFFSHRRSQNRHVGKRPFRPRFEPLEPRLVLSASVADLSGWVGVNNASEPNDYAALTTSAGGTFDARRFGGGKGPAYLADTSLAVPGGVLTVTTTGGFEASGSLSFNASTDNVSLVDPIMHVGFFDSNNLAAGAFGFTIADSSTTAFRFRAIAGTAQTSGLGVVGNQGIYNFQIDVNNSESGVNMVRFRLFDYFTAATVISVSVAIPSNLALQADSFGFLQPLASSGSDATFSFALTHITYTGDTRGLAAPSSLTATASPGEVNLVWQDHSDNQAGVVVERRSGPTGPWQQLAAVDPGVTNYTDASVAASTTYYYQVRAYDGSLSSGYSNKALATTPAAVPGADVADLSGFTGINNTAGTNDYAVVSSTSAGGTFQSRASFQAELSDATLVGGPFGFDTDLVISGTLTFANPDDAPSNFFFGLYSSGGTTFANTARLGLSLGNESAGYFRMQSAANNGSSMITSNLNHGTGSTGVPLAAGTYEFSITYNASTQQLTAMVGPLLRTVTLAGTFDQTDVLDRFGFRQWPTTPVSDVTFFFAVDGINYTGEKQVPASGTPSVPAAPTGLTAIATTGQVNLAWQDNSDNEMGFAIERRVGKTGTWQQIATVDASATSFTDTALLDSTTFLYRVRAYDGGLFSLYSNKADATTPAPEPAAAPSDLTADATVGRVNLSWQNNAANASGFVIERRIGTSGEWQHLVSVGPDATSYSDSGLAGDTTYHYRVQAFNAAGPSEWSNVAFATTPDVPAPVEVSAVDFSRTMIYQSRPEPGWTSWLGTWLMHDGSLMISFTQANGPLQPHHANRDYSGLQIDVVYLRSTDDGATWEKVVESNVSFGTGLDSGLGTHANNSPTTIALSDGSLIRRVYGWDYQQFPDIPGTAFMQISTDGGLTWSDPPESTDGGVTWSNPSPIQEFLLDPAEHTVQPTRIRRLSDGRLLLAGAVWNGPNTQSAPKEPLLMVSSDEAVSWQRIDLDGPGWDPAHMDKFTNEWDFAELPNGDLLIVSRVQNQPRWQALLVKAGDTWEVQAIGETTIPHSGHPELLATQEGPILYFATSGARWTNDAGENWNPLRVDSLPDLPGGDYRTRYYPNSIQTDDGWIYVFSHLGADDYYGRTDQSVWMDKFRLVATPVGDGAALEVTSPLLVAASGIESAAGSVSALSASAEKPLDGALAESHLLMFAGGLSPSTVPRPSVDARLTPLADRQVTTADRFVDRQVTEVRHAGPTFGMEVGLTDLPETAPEETLGSESSVVEIGVGIAEDRSSLLHPRKLRDSLSSFRSGLTRE